MRLKIFHPELNLYVPVFLFGGIFAFLNNGELGSGGAGSLLGYYLFIFLHAFRLLAAWSVVIVYFILIARLFIFAVSAWRKKTQFSFSVKGEFLRILQSTFSASKDAFRIVAPVFLALFLLGMVLDELSILSRFSLKDELLMSLDMKFFGRYAFVWLASLRYPVFFVKSVEFSFLYLVAFLMLTGLYLFFADRINLRKFAIAFSWSLVIMFPFWFFYPALSPQDRFIDNMYRLPVPNTIVQAIQTYRPQAEIAGVLGEVRNLKGKLKDMPISTMPSAHTAWAVIGAYYLYRARKILGLALLPLFLLSVLGTVFFAQHYFVDVWAGLIAGIAAIFIASKA